MIWLDFRAEKLLDFKPEFTFANQTLREVLKIEKRASFTRKIVGFLTLPIEFIPWIGTPLQKATEETMSQWLESRLRQKKEWFYLVSDIEKL
jgi:hypothetical protein